MLLLLAALSTQADPPPVTVWAEGLRNPACIAVDERGGVYVAEEGRVRRFEDADGDGRAERVDVFAEGFADGGPAGGLLVRRDETWLARSPSFWHLRDRDGDRRPETRKPWFGGFEARIAGPVAGPDGKLYFAAADAGFRTVSMEGDRLEFADLGAILRCDLDGSNLDVFAIGFRAPGDLAFDAAGNLWAVDEAAGAGDRARWIEVLEGGDYGWRAGYGATADAKRSPWIAEALWKGSPRVPPPALLLDGPTTAVAVEPDGRGRFLRADGSAVRAFRLEPAGTGWAVVEESVVCAEGRPIDVEPGVDGGLFILDAGGRILKRGGGAARAVVEGLAGLETCPLEELASRMGHADLRVRLQAQQELVRRQGSTQTLVEASRSGPSPQARIHAIWGLGQLYTRKSLLPMLREADPELRAQAARVLGDRRVRDAYDDLVAALRDESPRVRRHAATALGKIGRSDALRPIADMLRANDGRDPALRHAGAFAFALIGNAKALEGMRRDPSPEVRLAALVALRRLGRPEAAAFLDDGHPDVAVEAARAIHDLPIEEALPALAERLAGPAAAEPLARRAINAAFRTGRPDRLAEYAVRADAPPALRVEALEALAAWPKPPARDRVTGARRPLPERDASPAREALASRLETLRRDAAVASAASRAAEALKE